MSETPISKAVEMYLDTRETEVAEQTLSSHQYRLKHLIRWAEQEGYVMEDLTPKLLHQYRLWRQQDGDINNMTLYTQLTTVRVFIRFCGTVGIVDENLYDRIAIPSMREEDQRRKNILPLDRAERILEYLDTYDHASETHLIMTLLWETGCRIGGLQSLDVSDFDADDARLQFRHRPEQGTVLKKQSNGERTVSLKPDTTVLIQEYIDHTRHDKTDEYDREPLLTTAHGRPSTSTVRRHVYRATQPCLIQGECPYSTTIEKCEVIGYTCQPSGCDGMLPPHDIRRGAITHWLNNDVPKDIVGDRMNVADDALELHYDQRSEQQKSESRRQYLEDVYDS